MGSVGTSLSVVVGIALATYPLLVYATIDRFGPSGIAVVLAVVCIARLALVALRGSKSFARHGIAVACAGGALLAAVSLWRQSSSAVLYYPVLVNAILLLAFGASLWRPPTIVERIARIREPALPPAAVVYTRRVTLVWTVFFALNGAVALWTAVAMPLETWALYNGFIAYLLIGALFAAELAVRCVFRARLKQ